MRIQSIMSNQTFGQIAPEPKNVPNIVAKQMARVKGNIEMAMQEASNIGEPKTPDERNRVKWLAEIIRNQSERLDALGSEFDISLQEPANRRAVRTIGMG